MKLATSWVLELLTPVLLLIRETAINPSRRYGRLLSTTNSLPSLPIKFAFLNVGNSEGVHPSIVQSEQIAASKRLDLRG